MKTHFFTGSTTTTAPASYEIQKGDTLAKIAKRLQEKERKRVLLVSLDTYRPAAQEQLAVLGQQTDDLRAQRKRLETKSEIERIARDRFGMVKPGEQPWAVVPGASTTTTTVPGAVVPGR